MLKITGSSSFGVDVIPKYIKSTPNDEEPKNAESELTDEQIEALAELAAMNFHTAEA